MPNIVTDLIVNRVDLVDEGANSEAFIEIYKRKEQEVTMELKDILSKLKPEEAEVVQKAIDDVQAELTTANENLDVAKSALADKDTELSKANEQLAEATEQLNVLKAAKEECECDGEEKDGVCSVCGKAKKTTQTVQGMDEEEVIKGLPAEARAFVEKMRQQKEAAEELVRQNKEANEHAEAVAKAATLKALPVEQDKLVEIVKRCDADILGILETVCSTLEGTVLEEVGKNAGNGAGKTDADAWSELEKAAGEIAERDKITTQKAMGVAIKEHPELYAKYLNGGAN